MDAERWKRVDDLLQAALRLPAEQQEAFLREACAGDTPLVQEVMSLLRSQGELGDFLEKPALQGGIQNVTRTEAPGDRALIGQTVAHYEVLRRLGSGGLGVVYEAKDKRLGRLVALKFLPEKLVCDERALRRFEREARAASSLNHPNICTIHEVEEHDHQPVIVMELLEGVSLKQRIQEGPISTDELLDFGIQTSDALESAHAKGIIHRDIKPGNMFIVDLPRLPNPSTPVQTVAPLTPALVKKSITRCSRRLPPTWSFLLNLIIKLHIFILIQISSS